MRHLPALAIALLLSTPVVAVAAPTLAAAEGTAVADASPTIDPPLEVSGPIGADQYSADFQPCLRAAAGGEGVDRCAQAELDLQIRRLDAALHQSLVVAPDDDRRSLIQGRQAAWIAISNNRCFADLRKGGANRTLGLNCLISAAIRRRLAIEIGR